MESVAKGLQCHVVINRHPVLGIFAQKAAGYRAVLCAHVGAKEKVVSPIEMKEPQRTHRLYYFSFFLTPKLSHSDRQQQQHSTYWSLHTIIRVGVGDTRTMTLSSQITQVQCW